MAIEAENTEPINIKSHVNNAYVAAELNEGGRLIANRYLRREWEQFDLIRIDNNRIGFRCRENGQYVTADFDQGGQLKANRSWLHEWETFERIELGSGLIAIRSPVNNHFVTSDFDHGGLLIANRQSAQAWETFEFSPAVIDPPPPPPPKWCCRVFIQRLHGGGWELAHQETHDSFNRASGDAFSTKRHLEEQGFTVRSEVTEGPC